MKLPLRITGVFLIFALLTSCVAATENKDLPTKKEIIDFIDNFEAPESGDFTNSAYDAFIEEYPTGHCDVWSNGMISFYYYDPYSPKEYSAIYLDSNGEKVKPGCGGGITCIKSYKGENGSEKNTHVGTTSKETTHVGTPDDSTKEELATNQEQSESIQKLSEAVQELSESIQRQSDPVQQQSDSVQRQSDSVQQQSETDNQQSDPVQRQSETDSQQSDPNQKTPWAFIVLFVLLYIRYKRRSETDNQQSDPNQKTILSKIFSYDIIIKCLCYPLLVYFIAHKKGWVK